MATTKAFRAGYREGLKERPLIESEYPEVGKLCFDTKQFDGAIYLNKKIDALISSMGES